MNRGKLIIALTACVAVLAVAWAPAQAQVARAQVREGETLADGPTNYTVSSVGSVEINGIGGWAIQLNVTDPSSNSLASAWGTIDGVAAPGFYRFEGTYDNVVQTSWESTIGFSDAGGISYSPSGTENAVSIDAVFLDDVGIAVRARPTPSPLDGLFWAFASGPNMTFDGKPYFIGGFNDSGGASATNRGFFAGTGPDVLYYGGQLLPGMPDVIDPIATPAFDTRMSNHGYYWISEVEIANLGINDDNIMLLNGAAMTIDGGLVQENQPVPASIGGLSGELWDNFDSMWVNDAGEVLLTGDTTAATTEDEILYISHTGIIREGSMTTNGYVISGDMESATMNDNGDWVAIWDVNHPVEGNREALIFNGEALLIEEVDDVDWTGDGVADPGFKVSGTLAFSGTRLVRVTNRDANGKVKIYFTADISDNGAAELEGLFCLEAQAAVGLANDLEIYVSDAPDPVVSLPGQITYTVTVRNNGGNPLTGVSVVSTLDGNLVFNSGDPIAVHDGSPSGGTVTAAVGNLGAYGLTSYQFTCDVNVAGGVSTTTVATLNEADPDLGNNSATNDTDTGEVSDLRIDALTDSPDPLFDPNGAFTYDVSVVNGGPSPATNVVATVTLDAGLVFESSDLGTHDGSPTGGVVTVNIGGMASQDLVSFNVVAAPIAEGNFIVSADVTADQPDPDPNNNTMVQDSTFTIEADLVLTIADAPDPVAPVGGQITYTVTATNDGPSPAFDTNVALTLDGGTSFVSTTLGSHDGSPNGGVVTAALGDLADGASASFDVVVDTLATGRIPVAGLATTTSTDPVSENNAGASYTLVLDNLDPLPVGVFSNIAGHPTSDVPGLAPALFQNFSQPSQNLASTLWIIEADTDQATTTDEIIVVGSLCGAYVAAQEGVTVVDPNMGDIVGLIDSNLSINDSGDFTFATNTNAATTADEVIVKYDADTDTFEVIAREGDLAAPVAGNYGSILEASTILNNGQVWFIGDTDLSTTIDEVAFSKNGNTAEAQEGTTIPTGQLGAEAWDNFDTADLSASATGAVWALQGDLEGDTASEDIFAINNDVKIQENVPFGGFTSGADEVDYGFVFPNGEWLARGDNKDGQDWVVHNGAVIAATGDPVHVGALESYSQAPFSSTFFEFATNNKGDVIVAGTTNALEDRSNSVLVLNDSVVVAREDDPIDLNGDGVLNDPVRVRTFGNDDAILTDDFQLYVTCTMRDINDDGSNTDVGDALIRYNLCGIARPCGDIDGDSDVDFDDYLEFQAAFSSTACDADFRICADLDRDGLISFLDYQLWLVCYEEFNGLPFTNGRPHRLIPGRREAGSAEVGR